MQTLRRSTWFWFTLFWAIAVCVVSVIPSIELPSVHFWEPDKLAHVFVYAVLAYALAKTIFSQTTNRMRSIFVSLVICFSYGILLELIQKALPTRMFDPFDILANTLGAFCGAVLMRIIIPLR